MTVKRIAFWIVILFFIFIINNLIHSILSFSQKENLIVQKENELTKEKQENANLKKQLAQVNKPQFVEEQARNKLFLVKPGEGVLVIPTVEVSKSLPPENKQQDKSNWVLWWELFFK